ncbi:MAG TPA: SusD/RagB family nutrient-binding outer membrane lipoprotein [Chitinophagaceae bacterium]|nr:SusD/RagB family nutrient-binding outer membrane lipoprotein [Chitinophagaceae bacterium]
MKLSIKIISLCIIFFIITSCKKSFLDVNNNPNAVTDVPAKTLLPNTTISMGFVNSNELGKAAALLMQYNAGIINVAYAYDKWNLSSYDNQWSNEIYTNTINNLGILIHKTQEQSPAYSGIAKLELAYTFSMVTDLWGDVPYSEAGQGFGENGLLKFPQPRFDAQMDIYLGNQSKGIKSLFNLVREGLGDIASTSVLKPGADDLIYGGDLTRWTRFGNSLLLKFALQISNKAVDTTKAVINDIVNNNNPFINAIDGSLDFNVPFSKTNPNAYYLQDVGGSIPNTQMLGNRFLALERSLNDSLRLSRFYTKPAATFVGHDNGSPFLAPAQTIRSVYGTYVLGATKSGEAPIRLITAFRNYFILAEAALRFGIAGDPNTYYQNGIKAAMKSVGLTDTEITAYFTANPSIVSLSGTTDQKLQQIITQKYVASVGNAIESYNDYRRVGYPLLTPPIITEGDDPNTFPQRYPYTTQEGASNPNQPNPRPKTNVKVWWQL